jgi:hypothetical protein
MVRWMLELGWPKRISSSGGIFLNKEGASNCSDTQTATFEYDDLNIVWQHRRWGDLPDPKYWWGANLYGEKGTLKASVFDYEFFPLGKREPTLSGKPLFEYDKFPEDETEKDLERHVASAVRWHMIDLLGAIASRGKPVADIEQGHISSASCILANMSMKLGRTLVYDPVKRQVVGDEEATRLLRRPYRSPWVHPEPASV